MNKNPSVNALHCNLPVAMVVVLVEMVVALVVVVLVVLLLLLCLFLCHSPSAHNARTPTPPPPQTKPHLPLSLTPPSLSGYYT